jgi:HK97 family phage portal protein
LNLFGYELSFRKKAQPAGHLSNVNYYGGWGPWWGPVTEPFTGAWQRNVTVAPSPTLLSFSAVYACVTGIASDIAKLRIKLDRNEGGIWTEITEGSPWLPVLRKPNHYQTRIKFLEQWMVSKLLYGNTYVLKQRQDRRGIVTAMYVLHPRCVTTLVAENGDVYYELHRDDLSKVNESMDERVENGERPFVVPASEIIHDMMVSLWHPLVGVSPLYACGASAAMGAGIQANSTQLFTNQSRPGGIILVPGEIGQSTADRLKANFEAGYSGSNLGRTAVLSDGMTFQQLSIPAEDAQLIEQLTWTVEDVARAFHYPAWKLGGPMPPYTHPELAITSYYTDCLQAPIEAIELLLDHGLELPPDQGTEMDLDNLLRMDTNALYTSNNTAISGGWMSPNEARHRANLEPVDGGDSPMMQQQNWSLTQLEERQGPQDRADVAAPAPLPEPTPVKQLSAADMEFFEAELEKELVFQ